MDVEEFLTWAAFFALEPALETRVDAQTAMLMAQVYNMNRGKGKPARKAADFLPQWGQRGTRAEMTLEQMERAMRRQYLAMGGDPAKLVN